jgi:tight adherence protein B
MTTPPSITTPSALLGAPPFPGPADLPTAAAPVAFLALSVLLAIAMVKLIRRRHRSRRRLQRFARSPVPVSSPGAAPNPEAEERGLRRLVNAMASRLAVPGRHRRITIVLASAIAAALAWLVAGPVAALAAAGYLSTGATIALRVQDTRRADRCRAEAMEAVTALSADLRAGLPPTTALAAAWPSLSGLRSGSTPGSADGTRVAQGRPVGHRALEGRPVVVVTDPVGMLRGIGEPARAAVAWRLATAWRLAESSGVPLADILERLDTEFRDRELVRLRTAAQVAGARVTTVLLAGLPVAGLLLGAAIGAHPLQVLLHTPAGAACAVGAMLLQLLGVLWSARLSRPSDVLETHGRAPADRSAARRRSAPTAWAGAS